MSIKKMTIFKHVYERTIPRPSQVEVKKRKPGCPYSIPIIQFFPVFGGRGGGCKGVGHMGPGSWINTSKRVPNQTPPLPMYMYIFK